MHNFRLAALLIIAAGTAGISITQRANAASAAKQVDWPTGLYSDVRMSPESGDLGGMEIRFYEANGQHMAEFVMCEGWCNQSYHVELTRDGSRFRFGYVQGLTDENGKPVTGQRYDFIIQRKGRNLKILFEVMQDGNRVIIDQRVLKPGKRPNGLNVANSMRS